VVPLLQFLLASEEKRLVQLIDCPEAAAATTAAVIVRSCLYYIPFMLSCEGRGQEQGINKKSNSNVLLVFYHYFNAERI
jgi:hypothetical protein